MSILAGAVALAALVIACPLPRDAQAVFPAGNGSALKGVTWFNPSCYPGVDGRGVGLGQVYGEHTEGL
jgi:hypothetical protein